MTFTQSIRSVFSQYATFSGRASRSEFWWFFLFLFLVNLVVRFVDAALQVGTGYSGVGLLVFLAVLLPYLAVAVRRLHDSGRSGWWALGLVSAYVVGLVALFGAIIGGFVAAAGDSMGAQPSSDRVAAALIAVGVLGGVLLLGTLVAWIVLLTRPSTPGPNRYGPHPLLPTGYPVATAASPYGAPPPSYPQAPLG